jgi:glycosyltransferase involved in cell wall biosynthesis
MSFRALWHTDRYEPRDMRDAVPQTYHERLLACEACAHRVGHKCTRAENLCSVLARPVNATCPARAWGETREEASPVGADSKTQGVTRFVPGEDVPSRGLPLHAADASARPRPLRVGLFTDVFACGGVERWWLSLCRHWSTGDILTPAGIALTDRGAIYAPHIREALRFAPIYATKCRRAELRPLSSIVDPLAPSRIRLLDLETDACRALAAHCDIILTWCHADLPPLLGDFGGPVVLISHGEGAWSQHLMQGAAIGATHYAAVSRAAVNAFPTEIRRQVKVIENGIDLDRIAPTRSRLDVRAAWGISPDAIAVGYLGRNSPEKNPLAAARAVAAINRDNPGAAFAVYAHPHFGDNPEARNAVLQAAAGEAACITPDHMGDVLGALDVFMLASEQEGGSLGLLEALAAGIPCVVTAVGNVEDLEKRFGPLFTRVPIGATPAQLAAALWEATTTSHPNAFGGPEMVFHNFTSARMARDWESFLTCLTLSTSATP